MGFIANFGVTLICKMDKLLPSMVFFTMNPELYLPWILHLSLLYLQLLTAS